MYNASDLRKGLKIEIEGEPFEVVDFQFVKPGKGQALYRCKLKNLLSGATVDRTYRSVDKLDEPNLFERDMIYSYPDGDRYVFMDAQTYEEIGVTGTWLGDQRFFLIDGMEVKMLLFNNQPIGITLPFFIEKKIEQTEPGARGDTATNVLKSARLDNGYEVQVPLFVNEGDVIKIDTRTGKYASRVRSG